MIKKLTRCLTIIVWLIFATNPISAQNNKGNANSHPSKGRAGNYSLKTILQQAPVYQGILAALDESKAAQQAFFLKCQNKAGKVENSATVDCAKLGEALNKTHDSLEVLKTTYAFIAETYFNQKAEMVHEAPSIKEAEWLFVNGDIAAANARLDLKVMQKEKKSILRQRKKKKKVSEAVFQQKIDILSAQYLWKAALHALDFDNKDRLALVDEMIHHSLEIKNSYQRYFACGLIYYSLFEWDKAIKMNGKALDSCTVNFEKSIMAYGLGYNCSKVGKDEMAEKYIENSVEYAKLAFNDHPFEAVYLNNLIRSYDSWAGFFQEALRFEEGDSVLLETVAFFEDIVHDYPECHINISSSYRALGYSQYSREQYEKAAMYYEKSLEHLGKSKYGSESEKDAAAVIIYKGLARSRSKLDLPTAEDAYQEAFEAYTRLVINEGETYNSKLGYLMNEYGLWLLNHGQSEAAYNKFYSAMILRKKEVMGGNLEAFNNFLSPFTNLSFPIDSLFAKQDWHSASLAQNEKLDVLLEISTLIPGLDSAIASERASLAWYLLFEGKYQESEKMSKLALKHDDTQNWIRTNLGHALLYQGKYEEAVAVYRKYLDLAENVQTNKEILVADWDRLEKENVLDARNLKQNLRARTWLIIQGK